jgi:hypothetical protein
MANDEAPPDTTATPAPADGAVVPVGEVAVASHETPSTEIEGETAAVAETDGEREPTLGPAVVALAPNQPRAPVSTRWGTDRDHALQSLARGSLAGAMVIGTGLLLVSAGLPQASLLVPVGLYGVGLWTAAKVLTRRTDERRVLRARAALPSRAEWAENELAAVASDPRASEDIRLEAAAHLALRALTRGDVPLAVRWMSGAPEAAANPQQRALGRGLLGELVRALLHWVAPRRFPEATPAAAFELPPGASVGLDRPRDADEFRALVALLAVAECVATDGEDAVAAALLRARHSGLPECFPTLWWLARGLAARRIERERALLDRDLDDDTRMLLRRMLPEVASARVAPLGYRVPGAMGRTEEDALERIAVPEPVREATELARTKTASDDAQAIEKQSERSMRAVLATLAAFGLLGMFAGAMSGPILAGMLVVGSILIPAIAANLVTMQQGALSGSRVAFLAHLDPPASERWLAEFERAPIVQERRSALSIDDAMLWAACVMAEHDLAAGKTDDAWSRVAWWFRGLHEDALALQPLYPVAASLVRVAALSGHHEDAMRLLSVFAKRPRVRLATWVPGTTRTCHGDSQQALALAGALTAALRGRWEVASRYLAQAGRVRVIWLAERDAAMAGLVAAAIANHPETAHHAREAVTVWFVEPALIESHRAWLAGVAAPLLEAHDRRARASAALPPLPKPVSGS